VDVDPQINYTDVDKNNTVSKYPGKRLISSGHDDLRSGLPTSTYTDISYPVLVDGHAVPGVHGH
jgi:hypothetical protein